MEQFANIASTTLASNYTSGSGSISVSSATGFPTSGTFTVTLLNGSTVVLIYRVTSVSGTTFSGAAESADTNVTAGATVVGTMLSAAALSQIELDVQKGGSHIYQNQNPQGTYTWDNQGSATVTNVGSRTLGFTMPADNSSSVFHAYYQAVPGSTPYNVYLGLNTPPIFNTNYNGAGLCIGDSSGKYIFLHYSTSQSTVYVFSMNSTTSSVSVLADYGTNTGGVGVTAPNYLYFRVTDDGTNLTWYFSMDKWQWQQVYQAGRGAFLSSPARMGHMFYNQASSPASGYSVFDFGTSTPVVN
jgi:hypothetical protein